MTPPRWVPGGPITIGITASEFPSLERASRPLHPDDGHLVALAWVLDPGGRRILLVEHRTTGWSCPGGHVELGEAAIDAAGRELAEETGLVAEPAVPSPLVLARSTGCPRSGPDTVHWAAGYVFVVDPAMALTTEPGQPARWFALDDLPAGHATDIDLVTASIMNPSARSERR